jgi:acylphosphatase
VIRAVDDPLMMQRLLPVGMHQWPALSKPPSSKEPSAGNEFVMAAVRREIWYEGHVQGVGFRYTVAGVAQRYAVEGYVRNLPDGRVHLVCEGDGDDVAEFLEEVAERMDAVIRDTREDQRPATGEFSGFDIRY